MVPRTDGAGGQPLRPLAQNLRLAHGQNNLALRFFSLNFRTGGDIEYRYRLLPADTAFTYAHTRAANFSLLPPGRYTFEVQAQNEDEAWSEPARWAFEIRSPWWATWWFRLLVLAGLAAALYLFYKNRLEAEREKSATREKIRDFEMAALRAQMDPHFIFNCLQAIQSFVARNDRDAAADYLARFAKLMRLALHGSVDGRHSLAAEMTMLENYLALERLRFGGKFDFVLRAEAIDDPGGLILPPLLVQPFVENALLHGLAGKSAGGFVAVEFTDLGNFLEVTVTDNGAVFSENEAATESDSTARPHKSVGMLLTQKRLDLLAGGGAKSGVERLSRENLRDENGLVTGARARILIPVASGIS